MTDGLGLHRSVSCHTNNSCSDIEEGRGRTWLVRLTCLLKSGELGCCLSFAISLHWIFAIGEKSLLFYRLCSSVCCLAFPPKQAVSS